MDKWVEFIRTHRWTILLAAVGLLLAILFLTIGFWKTLLLAVIVGLCLLIGTALDRGGTDAVSTFFKKLMDKDAGK